MKAVQGAHWRPAFMWSLSLVALLVTIAGLVVRQRNPAGRRIRTTVSYAALLVAALPVASWLVQLVPWWRWSAVLLPLLLVVIAAVIAAGAALAGRRDPVRALVTVTGVSAAVLLVDLLTGSRLQTSALLGDSPITAGRFYGAGNTAFGVLAGSALLATAVICAPPPGGSASRRRTVVAGGILLAVAAVDGAPSLGADLGGALSFVPSALLLVLLLTGARLTWRRALVTLAAGTVPVAAVAIWDFRRPVGRRTHIGDFVAEVVHGQAGSVLRRKLAANLGQLGSSPFLPLVLGTILGAAALVLLARRGRGARLERLVAPTPGPVPGLVPGLVAVLVCAVLGGVLNDSGVTVTGIMLSVALPAVTALALRAEQAARTDYAERADPVNTG